MTGSRAGGDPALRPQPCVSRLRPPGALAAPVAVCGRHPHTLVATALRTRREAEPGLGSRTTGSEYTEE